MKQNLMKTKSLIALAALALLPFISVYAQAPAAANLSPAAAEVARLAGAGTSEEVVMAFVQNSQAPFNLSADHVLYLKDVGVPSPVVAAMLTHDSAFRAQAPAPVVEAPPPQAAPVPMAAPGPGPEQAPPPGPQVAVASSTPPADVAYFYHDLSPYGTWADLPGFGWCWQPSVVSATVGWQPYCHGGHWVNTDGGWFWASDYSWGWAPFHYGRWHRHPTAGWVWFPAREWAPAWVVWRSGGDACGWAPLPLHADFVIGGGWRFNGVSVSAGFDFGLSVGCFSFVSMGHFCDHNLYACRLPAAQVTIIYRNTTVINNYSYVNNTYVNHGINVTVVEKATGQHLQRVSIQESKAGGGAVAGLGVYRRPLGKPAPITGLTAVKMDNRGRIPARFSDTSKFTSTSATASSGKSTGTGSQASKFTSTGTKVTGTTHNFSSEKLDANAHAAGGSGSTGKFTSTSGETLGKTSGSASQNSKFTTTTGDARLRSTSGSSNPSKFTSTSVNEVNGKANQSSGTGSGSGNPNSNLKLSNTKATSTFSSGEADTKTMNKTLHSEDLRGASSLTSHDSKAMSYTTSGNNSKNTSGSSSGSGSSGSSNSRYQSGSSSQHSSGTSSSSSSGSKGSSSSSSTKDPNSTSGSGSGYSR
jgi:hypothetical protein